MELWVNSHTAPTNLGEHEAIDVVGSVIPLSLYKSGKLLVTQHNVGVKSQAVFQLTPKLYFGVVKDVCYGDIFKSLMTTQSHFMVNRNDFASGLVINLVINQASIIW